MKSYAFLFVVLFVLVQTYLSQAKLTESLSDTDNFEHSLSKRLHKTWGKRLTKVWGKRSESEGDEFYQRILRELYHNARPNQLAHRQYLADDDFNPLTFEQLVAQRTPWNDDNEASAENNS